MRPYYERDGITVLHGDARELVPAMPPGSFEACITDPVWPNPGRVKLAGVDDPKGLFAAVVRCLPGRAARLVVHLGCDSDPRMLEAVPAEFPFIRTCWLEFVQPSYKGRVLFTSDVAYVFGAPPASVPGARVLPGKCLAQDPSDVRSAGHPCARRPQHVMWLVGWFAGAGAVLDPFAGSGTTLIAARAHGRRAVGIEVEERYCEVIANRLERQHPPLPGIAPASETQGNFAFARGPGA